MSNPTALTPRFSLDSPGSDRSVDSVGGPDAAATAPPPLPRLNVLIIEDERDQAELAAQVLQFHGHESAIAVTGREGLARIQQSAPDLILLDLMLPDLNGYEVCRCIRGDFATLGIPIVMVTALTDLRQRAMGFRVGANAYVTKPYSPSELIDGIAQAWEWREKLRQKRLHGEIHVEIKSEAGFLQEVNEFLTNLSLATPLTRDQVMHLRQAIMEMGSNAIEWGNQKRAEALVCISYRIFEDHVEIVVKDEGPGFDRSRLAHAARPEDPISHLDVRERLGLREGGFGLLICQGMVDEVHYNDRGNEVTLIQRFLPPADSSSPSPASPVLLDDPQDSL
mgnify:CR=1 FL=1